VKVVLAVLRESEPCIVRAGFVVPRMSERESWFIVRVVQFYVLEEEKEKKEVKSRVSVDFFTRINFAIRLRKQA